MTTLLAAAWSLASVALPQQPRDLDALLRDLPTKSAAILRARAEHRVQILLAEPVAHANGRTTLVKSRLGDARQYFYPASSIKLCGAIAALLALNERNRQDGTAHGLSTRWSIGTLFANNPVVDADPTNVDGGALTVAHDLRKLFLVSDNAAFNHCFELVGEAGIDRAMWDAGFASVRIWHRLDEAHPLDESRRSRPVTLRTGEVETKLPARDTGIELENDLWHDLDVGLAVERDGKRIEGPMSFAQKNAVSLDDLQDLLAAVVRPDVDTGKRGFPGLTVEQRAFVVHALGELPRESPNPRYDVATWPDHACKFVLRGVRRVVPAEYLRCYDKIGRAYGFTIENAWLEDTRTARGCFLALVVYTNDDGVLNDDRYDFDVADAFCDDVGEVIARAVFTR